MSLLGDRLNPCLCVCACLCHALVILHIKSHPRNAECPTNPVWTLYKHFPAFSFLQLLMEHDTVKSLVAFSTAGKNTFMDRRSSFF